MAPETKSPGLFKWAILGLLLAAGVFLAPQMVELFNKNKAALPALKAAFSTDLEPRQAAAELLKADAEQDCRLNWLGARLAGPAGILQSADGQELLRCSQDYVELLSVTRPEDSALAAQAVQAYPRSVAAWFWLGESQIAKTPAAALPAYQQVVALDGQNALAWCQMGRIYFNSGKLEQAEQVFYQCCLNGDPGANGCWGAGKSAEQLGKVRQAIDYYNLSKWKTALERAAQLQKTLP